MRYLYLIIILLLLNGCKTAPINQKANKKRVGLWIEHYSIDTTHYKSVGRYKNGEPLRKWLYYTNDKISKKEIYSKNKCVITYYNTNGTIQSKGKTKLVVTGPELHWFYYGNWKYFDKKGRLIAIKKYDKGEFVSEIIPSPLAKK